MTEQERHQLDRDGYVVLEDAMGPELLRELREAIHAQFEREGDRAGHEFKTEEHARRLANLVNKGEVFRRAILLPRMIEGVRHVLGADAKLSSLNARSADPHSDEGQPLHVDMSAIPDERGYWVCNTVWLLDDFTPDNGATRVVPGSHLWRQRPQDALADPMAPHPAGGAGARQGRQHRGDELAHLARRHRQPHGGAATRHARLLLPARQAAAAVPEAAARRRTSRRGCRRSCATCWPSTIR